MTDPAILKLARERAAANYTPGSMPYRGIMTGQWTAGGSVMRNAIKAVEEDALRHPVEDQADG